ncbi:MAG: Arm DNA-binding domain-containing protein, partial [Ruminobacter sp.]|nr:Arm DNA-binding domain-containing protein [Ruminobacter sp.]
MITYAEARAAKPKNGKEISLSDGNGLYLRIRVNGSKSWYLQKSINGKIQKKVIGLFPDIGISEARVTAKMLIKQLTETTSDEARKKEVTSQTFKQVYDA